MKQKTEKVEKRNNHWEMHVNVNPQGKNTPENAFLPKQAKYRPQPHAKINECDH